MKLKQTDGDVKSDTKMKTGAILTKKTKQNEEHFQRGPLELPLNCGSNCLKLPLRSNCLQTAARTAVELLELPLELSSTCP